MFVKHARTNFWVAYGETVSSRVLDELIQLTQIYFTSLNCILRILQSDNSNYFVCTISCSKSYDNVLSKLTYWATVGRLRFSYFPGTYLLSLCGIFK